VVQYHPVATIIFVLLGSVFLLTRMAKRLVVGCCPELRGVIRVPFSEDLVQCIAAGDSNRTPILPLIANPHNLDVFIKCIFIISRLHIRLLLIVALSAEFNYSLYLLI
jgi:hypothetical protein